MVFYEKIKITDERRREGGSGHTRSKSLHATETLQVTIPWIHDGPDDDSDDEEHDDDDEDDEEEEDGDDDDEDGDGGS